jgi:hypothetical protein
VSVTDGYEETMEHVDRVLAALERHFCVQTREGGRLRLPARKAPDASR